jgi:hypothetical protein
LLARRVRASQDAGSANAGFTRREGSPKQDLGLLRVTIKITSALTYGGNVSAANEKRPDRIAG